MKQKKNEISFNLVDEAWIPVLTLQGERKEVSLKEVLLNAEKFREIDDGSPLVTIALYRFLLAVLHRALEGPSDIAVAAKWYKEGFPKNKIEEYLENWYDRFDLFHPEHPFYQTPEIVNPDYKDEWLRLTSTEGPYNTNSLFNETRRKQYVKFCVSGKPSEVARQLIQHSSFALDGMIRRPAFRQKSSPLIDLAIVLVKGENLRETFLLNLPPYNEKSDSPIWEREPIKWKALNQKDAPLRAAKGVADLYTWPSRTFYIDPQEFKNHNEIQQIYYACGTDFDSGKNAVVDPMICYRTDKKKGVLPLRLRLEKSFWRDYQSLYNSTVNHNTAPIVVTHALKLLDRVSNNYSPSLAIFGLSKSGSGQKISDQRMESFGLLSNFAEEELYDFFLRVIQEAEISQKSLNTSIWNLARYLLSAGDRSLDTNDIDKLRNSFPHNMIYWSHMERAFHRFLSKLKPGFDEANVKLFWKTEQIAALDKAWGAVALATGNDARALRALSKSSFEINKRKKELRGESNDVEESA